MVQSMYAGALGIQAHQQAMDIEGNNIANVNTVGFKYSRANFSEMLNQTMKSVSAPTSGGKGGTNGLQVGLGSEVGTTTKIFKQGPLQSTDKTTDLALSGDGMFVVSGDNGRTKQYTRAGNFDFDVAGNLVDPSGNKVQGWNSDSDFFVDTTMPVEGIKVNPKLKVPANATTSITAKGNLNSEESIKSLFNLKEGETINVNGTTYTYTDSNAPAGGQFHTAQELAAAMGATVVDGKFEVAGGITSVSGDNSELVNALTPLMGGTQSKRVAPYYAMSLDVYDSLGEKSTITIKFDKNTAAGATNNSWDMTIQSPAPVDIAEGNTATAGNRQVTGTITFNPDGSIASLTPTSFAMTANNTSKPDQKIALDFGSKFDGLTSLAKVSDVSDLNQNGYASGDLKDITIDNSGVVLGAFSNGETLSLGQVSVAQFKNNEGLSNIGSNLFAATPSSGEPTIGVASQGGRADIVSSMLEMSNADLSKSLTQLIVIQRGFQASSKTITTTDTMLDTLIQIKR